MPYTGYIVPWIQHLIILCIVQRIPYKLSGDEERGVCLLRFNDDKYAMDGREFKNTVAIIGHWYNDNGVYLSEDEFTGCTPHGIASQVLQRVITHQS